MAKLSLNVKTVFARCQSPDFTFDERSFYSG